jgi:NADPH:quinone reductase-like Zn-dependent oxidoreductase
MKAAVVEASAQGVSLRLTDVAQPLPGAGDVLVRVHAVGVTRTELGWYPTTHTPAGEPRIQAIPGHEFSGVIAALGENASGLRVGDAVYGMNDWFAEGATAEYCVTQPASLALKPAILTHEEAATAPIGTLTAWQGLFERADLQPGERVLVHGGAGAVGIFAVQLAHLHGAHVMATASAKNVAFVRGLGADEVIDYATARFEDAGMVDIVFDTVGGETRQRSWALLKDRSRMVSIAAEGEVLTDPAVRDAYFIVKPDRGQLMEVAKLIDGGALKTFVNAAVPLSRAAEAYGGNAGQRRGYGKMVIVISGNEAA